MFHGKIHEIADFENAIYCLHTSVDKSGDHNIIEEIQKFKQEFPQIQNICVAGGIKLDVCKELKRKYSICDRRISDHKSREYGRKIKEI